MKTPKLRSSVNQEKSIARDTLGKRTAGSGSQPGHKGDVKAGDWLVEAKDTKRSSWQLKLDLWRKIEREAIQARKEPALVVDVAGRRLVIIDYDCWLGMVCVD